ncbi:MAG: glutathione S-transferase N-terminal domain-containing protein [Myxococcota bacterium]|nr:glutathione S-transferase N-terminal domain-containing protein [Myxococcota bacterium]
MSEPYVLYGSHASYYTARPRALLRKKGIPFVERLPSAPRFREVVRPTTGSHRIPQLEAPDGTVIQDSLEIADFLEARHPELPSFPEGPRQRLFVHLFELLGSEGLVGLAWKFRWLHPDENLHFVKMDFGRSFRPQGSDEELLHYGGRIADRMLSHGRTEASPETLDAMDEEYTALLSRLETHFIEHPYLLGGHPSAADYSLMGALFAHLGRDPLPRRRMQETAPRVFRWVEHMLVPDVQSPEFFDRPIEYPANDEIPPTAEDVLRHLLTRYGEGFRANVVAVNEYVERNGLSAGDAFSKETDQPVLDGCNPHFAWVTQRALDHYASLEGADREHCRELMERCGGLALIETKLAQRIERRDHRLFVA